MHAENCPGGRCRRASEGEPRTNADPGLGL